MKSKGPVCLVTVTGSICFNLLIDRLHIIYYNVVYTGHTKSVELINEKNKTGIITCLTYK